MSRVFPYFAGNSRAQKLNKAHTNQAKITGVHYFTGFDLAYTRMNRSGVNFVPSFILFFYFLIICANFPFHLKHQQSTPPLVWKGMHKHMTASPSDRRTTPIRRWKRTPRLRPLCQPLRLQVCICHCDSE